MRIDPAKLCTVTAAFVILTCDHAMSQVSDSPSIGGLETVTVTARKRNENEQAVPIALTAISGSQLEDRNITQIQQLRFQAPSLSVTVGNPRITNFAIRGLGNNQAADGLSASVGLYMDGVYLDRQGMANFDLLDIDQVEVLRGPQGTLFGKNTTAGAVSFSTLAPEFKYQLDGTIKLGDYGFNQSQIRVTGPITDTLAFRISVYATNRNGYVDDIYDGRNLLSLHRQGARAQLLYRPGNDFSWRVIGEYGREKDSAGAAVLYSKGPSASPNPSFLAYDSWAGNLGINPVFNPVGLVNDQNGHQQQTELEYAATSLLEWRLGELTLNSITGWRYWSFEPHNDPDWTYADVLRDTGTTNRVRQFSQELRLTSPTNQALEYALGVYYFWRNLTGDTLLQYGSQYSAGLGAAGNPALNNGSSHLNANLSNNSYALFFQGTWHMDPQWNFTAGLRGTYELAEGTISRAAFSGGSGTPPPTVAPYSGSISTSNLTPSALATLDYHPDDNLMVYGTVSYSAKAGGFNPAVPSTVSGIVLPISTLKVNPERIVNFELGSKGELMDRRLKLNLSAYWAEVYDYQAATLMQFSTGALQLLLTNVGAVRSRGFEAETVFLPVDHFRLDASLAYNEASYRSFPNAPAVQGSSGFTQNLSGRPVVQSPKWGVSLGVSYDQNIATNMDGYARGEVGFKSGYFGYNDDSSYSHVGGATVADVRVGLTYRNFDVSAWVQNIGDARLFYNVLPVQTGSAGYAAFVAEPRTFGVTLRIST
jgi:iron complex outermembrane receptor protein